MRAGCAFVRLRAVRDHLAFSSDFGDVELAALDELVSVDDELEPDAPVPAPEVVPPVEPVALPGVVPAALDDVEPDGAMDEGAVVVDDELDDAGGGVTVVDEDDEAGGDDGAGAASWRCWQAPSANNALTAAAVMSRRFIAGFSLASVGEMPRLG